MNSENSEICDPDGLLLNYLDNIKVKEKGYVALSNLSIYYTSTNLTMYGQI